jgi:hypothetical protein
MQVHKSGFGFNFQIKNLQPIKGQPFDTENKNTNLPLTAMGKFILKYFEAG